MLEKIDAVGEYKIFRLPKHRELLSDLERMITKHPILTPLEVDVTEARNLLQRHKESTGETVSFTAWLIKCISQTVSEDKMVQAYRKGKQPFVFEDVDVTFVMDKAAPGANMVASAVVRKASEKSVRQIHDEIRTAQDEKVVRGAVVGQGEDARLGGLLQILPRSSEK